MKSKKNIEKRFDTSFCFRKNFMKSERPMSNLEHNTKILSNLTNGAQTSCRKVSSVGLIY